MRQAFQFFCDLQGQFAGRRQDYLLDMRCVYIDVLKHRNTKGYGFTGSGGGNADDVTACHHGRYGLRLYSGRAVYVHSFQGFKYLS